MYNEKAGTEAPIKLATIILLILKSLLKVIKITKKSKKSIAYNIRILKSMMNRILEKGICT